MKKRTWLTFVSLFLIGLIGYMAYIHYSGLPDRFVDLNPSEVERTYRNYGDEVKVVSAQFNIDPKYLLALIALESSGRKIVPHRYEPGVFNRLKRIQKGEEKRMEQVTTNSLSGMSSAALKNLASSWGPFQIMGYKCFEMGIKVADIRGNNAVFYGAKWIRDNYGQLLDDKRYKDAFHYHNAGQEFPRSGIPKTYDKDYVPKGLRYMKEFEAYF